MYPHLVEGTSIFMEFSEKAKEVLSLNWRDGYTIPSSTLYPFQWNWDAGFHALGWMYTNPERAIQEIRSMFKGQWKNGMLPHIVFHQQNDQYFPGPDVWKTDMSKFHNSTVPTSGITQLPVFGFFLERIDQIATSIELDIKDFVIDIFPKIVAFHKYLYTYRDPYQEGLPFILHNWESTDNAPIWDAIWERMHVDRARDVSALRKDLNHVDASMRPTNEHYKRYIHLIDLLIEKNYDEKSLLENYPFLVQENLFISLLVRSNEGLIKIGKKYNILTDNISNWQDLSIKSFRNKFWDDENQMFYPFDLKNKTLIKKDIIGGLIPLFAGIPSKEQAHHLVQKIEREFLLNNDWFLCPSYSPVSLDFDAKKYWRGPMWPNVNWLLYHGLKRYRYDELADKIKSQTMYLIEKVGFFEYFDPRPINESALQEKGLGGRLFSWTAAIYLDFKHNTSIF